MYKTRIEHGERKRGGRSVSKGSLVGTFSNQSILASPTSPHLPSGVVLCDVWAPPSNPWLWGVPLMTKQSWILLGRGIYTEDRTPGVNNWELNHGKSDQEIMGATNHKLQAVEEEDPLST